MATLVKYRDGLRRIEFAYAANERRKEIRLGRISQKVAEAWLAKVEAIIADKQMRKPHDPEIANWLKALDKKMLARLRAVGLAEGVGNTHVRLDQALNEVTDTMTVKTNTAIFYRNTVRNLLAFFGANTLVTNITTRHADQWRKWLIDDQKLSPATVSRRVLAARTFFKKICRWGYISTNPFADVKAGKQSNPARAYFITPEDTQRVLDACPDDEWRLIVALSRYGGLRCPSEHLLLTWSDIDWEQRKFRVHSPKTEHHAGMESRWVPLFAELYPYLLRAFEQAAPGSVHVISRYRSPNANLRTQLTKIIKRAGLTPWPRLFHNLRASRQTELARKYALKSACEWLGNTKGIAMDYYLQSPESDFALAAGLTGPGKEPAKEPAKRPVVSGGMGVSAVDSAPGKNDGSLETTGTCQPLSSQGFGGQNDPMGRAGIEPATHGFSIHCSTS